MSVYDKVTITYRFSFAVKNILRTFSMNFKSLIDFLSILPSKNIWASLSVCKCLIIRVK